MNRTVAECREALTSVIGSELRKCSKCGSCASVCPIYAEVRSETGCSRGKLQLAKAALQDGGAPTERLADILNNCLLCLACRENCPGGVRMDKVFLAARELLDAEGRQSRIKKALFENLLAKPSVLDAAARCAGVLQPLAFAAIPGNSGLRRRFPLPLLAEDQPIPRLASSPFRHRRPDIVPATGERIGTVMYFVGCAANYLYPTIGEAVLHILTSLGYEVLIPEGQGCCGTPVEVSGETSVLAGLVHANLDAFADRPHPVITACGSGGMMFRRSYPALASASDRHAAEDVASRATDITEFLVRTVGMERIGAAIRRRTDAAVTYHEPCHLGRGLCIHDEPRAIIRAVAERFTEMNEASRCCGSGGTYGAAHWDISRRILDRKIGNIVASGAAVTATGCPSCILQIEGGLANNGVRGAALHTAELLAWAMGYMPERPEERTRFELLSGR